MDNEFCPEYYAMVWDSNKNSPKSWNIYHNIPFRDAAIKAVKKYDRAPGKYKTHICVNQNARINLYGLDAFVHEIKSMLMWQFWARCEYELLISDFPPHIDKETNEERKYKIDVYNQVVPNVEVIANDLLRQYRKWRKNNGR